MSLHSASFFTIDINLGHIKYFFNVFAWNLIICYPLWETSVGNLAVLLGPATLYDCWIMTSYQQNFDTETFPFYQPFCKLETECIYTKASP